MEITVKVHLEVAKRYIEKAFDAGWINCEHNPGFGSEETKQDWLIDNGIIESTPGIVVSNGLTSTE